VITLDVAEPETMPFATIRSILVTTDLSPSSDGVLRAASDLAKRTGSELHVLSVFAANSSVFAADTLPRAVVEEAEGALASQVRRVLSEETAPASRVARFGSAADEIVDHASRVAADLIMLGAHRGGNVEASFLGTTTDRVIRTAPVPCLVIRGSAAFSTRRIGVPVDFSALSDRALAITIRWFGRLDPAGPAGNDDAATFHVLHVQQPAERGSMKDEVTAETLDAHIERVLEAGPGERPRIHAGVLQDASPEQTILRWAEESGLTLLVMGTEGRSEHGRARIGSVASAVARRSPCAVLLVPPSRSPG
jgi:universal stress protein E